MTLTKMPARTVQRPGPAQATTNQHGKAFVAMENNVAPVTDTISPLTREAVRHMTTTFNPKSPEALRQDRHAAYMSALDSSLFSGARVVQIRTLAIGTVTGLSPDGTATVEWDELATSNRVRVSDLALLRVRFERGQRVTHTLTGDSGTVVDWDPEMCGWFRVGEVPVQFDDRESPQGIDTAMLVREDSNFVPVKLWEGVKVYYSGDLTREQEAAEARHIRQVLRPMGLSVRKNSAKMPRQDGYGSYAIVHSKTGEVIHQRVHLDDVLELIA